MSENENSSSIIIPAPKRAEVRLRAVGMSPLLCNNGKDLAGVLLDTQGVKGDNAPKRRSKRGIEHDPEAEYNRARYRVDDNHDGFPAHRIKGAAIFTAHTFVPEVSKVFVRGAMFVVADYHGWLLRIDADVYPPPVDMRTERVGGKGPGTGTPSPRWRPLYDKWSIPFTVRYLENMITLPNLINLLNMAGMCAGLGEHRPEKGGDLGTFTIVAEEQWQAENKKRKR